MPTTNRTTIRAAAAFLLGYAVLAAVGRATSLETTFALLWPAAGVAFAWLLWAPDRLHRLAALAGMAIVWALIAIPAPLDLGPLLVGAVIHAATALLTAHLFKVLRSRSHAERPEWLATPRHAVDLVLAALLGAAATSVPATLVAAWNDGVWQTDLAWSWIGRNASGVVVVGAVLLLSLDERFVTDRVEDDRSRTAVRLEMTAHLLSSLALGWVVFGPSYDLPLSFGCLAGATWAGYRFSPLVATKASVLYGSGAAVVTLIGWGPFSILADEFHQAVVVQLFAASGTILALLLSLSVREHRSIALRLARSEADARRQSDLFSAVAASMTDGVLVIDRDGSVVLSNPAADALLGRGGRLGRIDEVTIGFQELDRSEIDLESSPYARALAGETVHGHPYLHTHPVTGRESVQSVTVAPLAGPSAGTGSVAVLLHDVTAQQAQLAELQSFAGVVAHDLKSPLTSVVAWGQLLQTDDDPALQREGLDRVLAAAFRMDRLIDDLLDYTRTTARKLGAEELDLDELVQTLADEIDSETGRRVIVEHDGLDTVVADPTLTKQTLNNLLRNAAKYVAPGVDPHIRVTSRPQGDMVAVTITDNGIGIPADARHRVFETFYRAAHSYPGTGLGLAICKRAVERHGGEIRVEDAPTSGTAITFTLPAARSSVAA